MRINISICRILKIQNAGDWNYLKNGVDSPQNNKKLNEAHFQDFLISAQKAK